MKHVFYSYWILCGLVGYSQNSDYDREIAKEINEQVWKPFKAAYESRDAAKFNDLHTDDVLRVSQWGIRVGSEYKDGNTQSYARKDRPERTIDFWMEHRIFSDDIAYEVGYYKVIAKEAQGPRESYARFHVVLKKVDGIWKIAQDWDTNKINGQEITAADYEKGTPLKL